jgi:hypothetical protein
MAIAETIKNLAENEEHREGKITESLEHQSAKIPSVVYLNLAFASIAASIAVAATSKKAEWANFVGLWAPSFMLIGIYNKIVKQASSK